MAQTVDYKLCGGTFFTLLSSARKPLLTKEQNYNGQASGLTEPEMLLDLARVVVPELRKPMDSELRTLRDNTRKFKACINWGGGTFCFGDSAVNTSFDEKVKKQYSEVLTAMSAFVEKYLDVRTSTKKDEYLIKALVEVISNDNGIDHDQPFLVCEGGSALTRDEISRVTDVCVPSFLLGIWHFVLTGIDNNKIGAATYNAWCPPKSRAERVYTAAIGERSSRSVSLRYCDIPSDDVAPDEDGADIVEDVEEEILEPAVEPPKGSAYTPVKQVVMNNYGNGTQIDTVEGNLTITVGAPTGQADSVALDYFNLFVGFKPFASDHFIVRTDRVFTEGYTPDVAKSRFASLDDTAVAGIKQLPTIIVDEFCKTDAHEKNAVLAFVTSVRRQQNGVKIYFKTIRTIPAQVLIDNEFELGMDMGLESYRTHWAIKNINLWEVLQDAGIPIWGGGANEG